MIIIKCGDCLNIIRKIRDHCVDAIIMDPPYPNFRVSRGNSEHAQRLTAENDRGALNLGGLIWLMRAIASESCRIVKDTGALLIFCDCTMLPELVPVVEAGGPRYKDIIVWDKEHFGTGSGFRMQHEFIAHFQYGAAEYYDRSTGTVLRCKRTSKADQIHINQKPIGLLESLIKVVTPPGGIVLDPFMGSGSTGKACLNLGRSFIGIDINPGHCERATQWLSVA